MNCTAVKKERPPSTQLSRRKYIDTRRLRVIVSGSPPKATTEKLGIPEDLILERKRDDPFDPRPREGYLSWDDYFMCVAFLSAQRSKDPNKQVGACIVSSDQIILGIGYNGFPRGCSDNELPWAKCADSGSPLDTKYPYVCHAELNAILNKNTASLQGAKMYVTMFPCNECSKLLIQAGIREIVFYEDKAAPPVKYSSPNEAPGSDIRQVDAYAASKRLLHLAGVKLRQHQLDRPLVLCVGVHAEKKDIVLNADAT
ncbi:g6453 [Coccomyxa elongata]